MPRERRLDMGAWAEIFGALSARGVHRLRITGGEPLLHPDVVALVRLAASTRGITDVALTTNATHLERLARPLRDAGLGRLNISVDSLRTDRFAAITRGGSLSRVLLGISAALDAGFDEIKTNTVVLRADHAGIGNDDELEEIVAWAWSWGLLPRFIELMPLGVAAQLEDRFVPYTAMRAALAGLLVSGDDDFRADPNRGPARYVTARDGSGRRVGFITGTTRSFCEGCDRIRVASDGSVRSCLARSDCVDMAAAARAGDAQALARGLQYAWEQKPDTTSWRGTMEGSSRKVSMRVIGG